MIICWNTDSRGNLKALNCLWHGNIVKYDFFIIWQETYHDKGFKNYKYMHLYGLGKGTMETGHLKMFQRSSDTLFSGKRDILPSGNDFFLWESGHISSGNRTVYPLGFGTSSGNGTIYPLGFGTSSGKRDTLSSGIWTTYSLGNILGESGIWKSVFNRVAIHGTYNGVCWWGA